MRIFASDSELCVSLTMYLYLYYTLHTSRAGIFEPKVRLHLIGVEILRRYPHLGQTTQTEHGWLVEGGGFSWHKK